MRGHWAVVGSEFLSLMLLCVVSGAVLAPTIMDAMRGDARPEGPTIAPQPGSAPAPATQNPQVMDVALTTTTPPRILREGPALQCAIYARQRTSISLSGAAREWWARAEGRYRRSNKPEAGAVMAMGGTPSGHVAVVARVVNSREILIDHANWMGGGEVILGAPALDVSAANDWSQVRVWHPPTNSLGLRPYPVQGFIHPSTPAAPQAQKT